MGIDGNAGNQNSGSAWISANDRFISFVSQATNLTAAAPDTFQDAFEFDDCLGASGACYPPQLLSKTALGVEGSNGDSGAVSLSGDGSVSALTSWATNLAPNSSGLGDVFYVPTGLP